MEQPVLAVEDLTVTFGAGTILNKVSFEVSKGETLGIVGESGCGKSMTALSIMRLMPSPSLMITGGSIRLEGEELLTASEDRMRSIRGGKAAMIFQDPMTSLNPLFTVGDQISESVRKHGSVSRREALDRATEMLKAVGIPDPLRHLHEYPHQLSGGKRQRVMIAIALAANPSVLFADEPTTALDVTVQAQIFEVLRDVQDRCGTALVLITHDMGAVAEMADRVAVMYAGRVVEEGLSKDILTAPRHPYTKGLISCIPHLSDETFDEWPIFPVIPGTVPSLVERGTGCAFAPRCPISDQRCVEQAPRLVKTGTRSTACWKDEGGPIL